MLGLAVYFAQTVAACATSFGTNQELTNEINERKRTEELAPESTIATVCGSDAQDPPIVADRRNFQTAVTEVQGFSRRTES